MLFEDLHYQYTRGPYELPCSEVWIYANDPTISNARTLLASLKIQAPYESLRKSKLSRSERPRPRPRPAAQRAAQVKPVSCIAAELAPLAIAFHERVNLIYKAHLNQYYSMQQTNLRILSADKDNASAFASFPGLCDTTFAEWRPFQSREHFARSASEELNAAFGLTFKECGLSSLRSDRRLHEQVTRWRSSETTEIMLDGIVTSPDDPMLIRTPQTEYVVRIVRSQALCAFLMLLLVDYDPALAPVPVAESAELPSIEILAGPFNRIDLLRFPEYMQRWTSAVYDAAPHLWKRVGFREIAPPLRSASGANVRTDDVQLPNGTVVPFCAPENSMWPHVSDYDDDDDGSYDLSEEEIIRMQNGPKMDGAPWFYRTLQVSFNRGWYRFLFGTYSYGFFPETEFDMRAELDPVIDDVIAVNTVRDTVNADIALARGAVYLTTERLSLMYYALRRTPESRGAGLLLHVRGFKDAKLGVYE